MEPLDTFKDTKRSLKKNLLSMEELIEKIEAIDDFGALSKNMVKARELKM